jgi:hypothetical protein
MEISSFWGINGKIMTDFSDSSLLSCETQEESMEGATTPAAPAPMDSSIKVLPFMIVLCQGSLNLGNYSIVRSAINKN